MIITLSVIISVLAFLVIGLAVRLNAIEDQLSKSAEDTNDMIVVLQAHDKMLHLLTEQSPKTEALQSYYDSIKGVA
jgi:uncharacterized membrane protein